MIKPNKMKRNLILLGCIIIVGVFAFEAYALFVQREGDSPLPQYFGNFQPIRDMLSEQPPKDKFSFAVMGDTKSIGTFEAIVKDLRDKPLDFAVLLGDCSFDGTEEAHRYLRAESSEYALPFPVFYVVGNHDISREKFPVNRFEQDYGPSIFSFEYQESLFIVLRILDNPFTNEESINFLKNLADDNLEKYRYRFVFLHVPPAISEIFHARQYKENEELVQWFTRLGIDYVFGGDFHGYARVKLRNTTYIVTGGGGARLEKKAPFKQFHHAVIMNVHQDAVSELIVPIEERKDIEDSIEKLAIIEIYPWLKQHKFLSLTLNGILFIVFAGLASSMRTSGKTPKGEKTEA